MAKPIVIFLVLAASCVFAKGGKPKRERCSCKTFSLSQERKLREILQSEALNLQTGLQEMCGQQKPGKFCFLDTGIRINNLLPRFKLKFNSYLSLS